MIDQYKHLNDDGDGAVLGIEAIAAQIESLNYGMHRMLSALVRVRLKSHPGDDLAKGIESLLAKGMF